MFQKLYIELSSYFWPQEGVVVIITSRPVKKTSHVRQLFERGENARRLWGKMHFCTHDAPTVFR